jgi:hypothetical protein
MAFLWNRKEKPTMKSMKVESFPLISGYKFILKGSPRHYFDVKAIIEQDLSKAAVYFGEALKYERGAGIAEWRVYANGFDWLPALYDWWANAERVEPIEFTFYLYLPSDLKYPVLDLREHTPQQVAEFIAANAPFEEKRSSRSKPMRMSSGQPDAHTRFGGRQKS